MRLCDYAIIVAVETVEAESTNCSDSLGERYVSEMAVETVEAESTKCSDSLGERNFLILAIDYDYDYVSEMAVETVEAESTKCSDSLGKRVEQSLKFPKMIWEEHQHCTCSFF